MPTDGDEEQPGVSSSTRRKRTTHMVSVEGDANDNAHPEASAPTTDERAHDFTKHVFEHVRDATWQRNEMESWLKDRSEETGTDRVMLQDHVDEIFRVSGVIDFESRIRTVEKAVHRQQQLLQERKNRKKERLRDAATGKTDKGSDRDPHSRASVKSDAHHHSHRDHHDDHDTHCDDHGEERRSTVKAGRIAEAFVNAAAAENAQTMWKEVQTFKTQEEAIQFVIECQPIDYQPQVSVTSENLESPPDQFPRFESTREALAHVLKMKPLPTEFASMACEFKRRLRIRKLEPEEMPVREHAPSSRGKGRSLLLKHRGTDAGRSHHHREASSHSTKERKPWIVETAGVLFERPPSLRDLKKDIAAKYFIAVSKDLEKDILAEGFRVKQRCSIPCAASPQEALAAFGRNEQRSGHAAALRATVLAVTLPHGVDVIAHRKSGFLIRCKELPPSCLSRIKRSGGGEAVGQS